MVYKRTEAFTNLIFSLMIFLTGSLVGLESLGRIFEVLRLVFPLTWGISLMRRVVAGDQSLLALYQGRELFGVVIHAIIYLAVGLFVFRWGYRRARVNGTMAHY